MKTLIELYDERPLENVLAVEMFRPERVVYICSEAAARCRSNRRRIENYFIHRGIKTDVSFASAQIFSSESILSLMERIVNKYPDCVIDITGGTDDALFAAGLLCGERDIPVFTYSRRKNSFFDIRRASFGVDLKCDVRHSVEDCLIMAGGAMRRGRVDNASLSRYLGYIDRFFEIYMRHRREWNKIVSYMQRVSQIPREEPVRLDVKGDYHVKGERGSRIEAPEEALRELEEMGFIKELSIVPGESVSFRFMDRQVRSWLRDVGSVLELYVYKACLDTGLFQDVRSSVVVDWDADDRRSAVSNELDLAATRGVTPLFISCKTCSVDTDALNELAILRGRFGGRIARAAVVTAERGGSAMRSRAEELDIAVIDLDDLRKGNLKRRISNIISRPGR